MSTKIDDIKEAFLTSVKKGHGFEESIATVAPLLNTMSNGYNFQLAFDVLHYFAWEPSGKEPVSVEEQDRISLKYSTFGDHQKVVQDQIQAAKEWAEALEEAGMSPLQALGFAKIECELEVAGEKYNADIIGSPSPLAIPQEIVRQYRTFYRAEKKYQPERTNVLKPVLLVIDVIAKSRSTGAELSQEVFGRLSAFMGQIRRQAAKGRWVISNQTDELKALQRFADFVVFHVLEKKFDGEKAYFSSKEIGLIKDACYALYVLEQDKENQQNPKN